MSQSVALPAGSLEDHSEVVVGVDHLSAKCIRRYAPSAVKKPKCPSNRATDALFTVVTVTVNLELISK